MAKSSDTTLKLIHAARSSAARSMLFERLWPRLLTILIVAALYATIAWFGVFRIIPDWVRIGLGAVFALLTLGALGFLFGLKRPNAEEIDRRLELGNALEHRPVATQSESLAQGGGDPFAEALWDEHRKRLADKLGNLQTPMPKPNIPARDPWASGGRARSCDCRASAGARRSRRAPWP